MKISFVRFLSTTATSNGDGQKMGPANRSDKFVNEIYKGGMQVPLLGRAIPHQAPINPDNNSGLPSGEEIRIKQCAITLASADRM